MTQEFADRMMTKEQQMRLDELQQEAFNKMKENQAELTENLEKLAVGREQHPDMAMMTEDQVREMHHGEMTNDEMWDKSIDIAHNTLEREVREQELGQNSLGQSKPELTFEEKMQQSQGSEQIEQAREEARQEQERQNQLERERNRTL